MPRTNEGNGWGRTGDAWRGGGGARVGSVPAASPFRDGAASGPEVSDVLVEPFGYDHHLRPPQPGNPRM